MVERACIPVSSLSRKKNDLQKTSNHIPPMKSANVVRVPCSASNRSNSGVKASIFMNAWKKPA